MKKINFLLFLLFASLAGNAQDVIRTSSDTIEAKVLEIGLDEIKYKDFNNPDGPVIVIAKSNVIEIVYQNGSRFFIAPDPYDVNKEVKIRDKTHSIKFEFFSPLTNDIAFGYETMLKVGTNLEFKLAVIGPGFAPNEKNASGFFFKGGVKFLTSQSSYLQNGVKYIHALKGFYIKPELIFNLYNIDDYVYSNYQPYGYPGYGNSPEKVRTRYTNFCLNIVFGKQYILGNVITMDYYIGLGYGLHSSNYKSNSLYESYDYNYDGGYEYSHLYLGKNFPMIISGGMTLGVLF